MPDGTSGLIVIKKAGDQVLKLGNCLTAMAGMPAQSIDVVVTSPPYNLNLAYGVYDDSREEPEYVDWLFEVSAAIKKVMKPNGSFFLNITGSSSRPYVPFELMVRLRGLGFFLQNHITWIKLIGMETEFARPLQAHWRPAVHASQP